MAESFVPVGGTYEATIGGKKFVFTNPGARAVLKAQEECLQPNGQISLLRYIELVGSRWVEPRVNVDGFADEEEILEFLRLWRDFRRPPTVASMTAEPAYCPPGQTSVIHLDENRKVTVVNPGLRWVLEAQESSTLPSGVLSILRFAERILKECAVGQPKFDDVFWHEDEVVEFLRLFRLLRTGPSERKAGLAPDTAGKPGPGA